MRRPPALAVDTTSPSVSEKRDVYELTQSPQSATTLSLDLKHPSSGSTLHIPAAEAAPFRPPQPSLALLFSLLPRRDLLLFVLPAVCTSLSAGGIAPFMTRVIGDQFNVFASFPLGNPTAADQHALLHGVGVASIELVGLGLGALALSSVTSSLWICAGERNAKNVRKRVFDAVTRKEMVWFDTKMGTEGTVQAIEGDGPMGAGGLMAKFVRETDEVRAASSLAAGMLIQYLTTTLACLALAFQRSWSLTLVILSAVPVLMVIQIVSQAAAGPILGVERTQTATAATLVDRAVAAIATVKAFNAQAHEQAALGAVLSRMRRAANRCAYVWGLTGALSQFATMAMFVQGFWFGAHLVRAGTNSAGDVMAVFWACLIATSNLQMCIPQFLVLAKGKFAAAALVALIEEPAATLPGRRRTALRGIVPTHCQGQLELQGVTFAYPSRPSMPVLADVSLYLAAGELTFIVGGSGSGKSTIAQLLLRLYEPARGQVALDEQDVAFLDRTWTRAHVASVSQNCILFDRSVHDNVAMGLAGQAGGRRPEDATREEVEAACRAALMHEFVRDLPEGYDTMLGTGGANLSGGQKQRLAIARAMLRNPIVLILDEATSALDATSRVLVFEAIKRWRRNMTTVVITHDLSQIQPEDFAYVLADGRVAEQGFRVDLESDATGVFRQMADAQGATGGFPVKDDAELALEEIDTDDDLEAILDQTSVESHNTDITSPSTVRHKSTAPNRKSAMPVPTLRPLTLGNWMFDVVADLTRAAPAVPALAREEDRVSRFVPASAFARDSVDFNERRTRRQSADMPSPPAYTVTAPRRLSLQFTPMSPVFAINIDNSASKDIDGDSMVEDDEEFDREKAALQNSGAEATRRRVREQGSTRWRDQASLTIKVDAPGGSAAASAAPEAAQQGFWALIRDVYPTVPSKPVLILGVLCALASGAMTPLFSFLLSRVMFEVSTGAQNMHAINMYGGIVLAVAAADGLFLGLKYTLLEWSAMTWVSRVRALCFERVLGQDKRWFDRTENAPSRMVQVLIKDGDDARTLIATVLGQMVVVIAMLSVGLVWALVQGWQLTLVGFAVAPVFAITMVVQTRLVSRCELRNKRAKEEVAKAYYETITNIRGIRSMGFETVFQADFDQSADKALSIGMRGAFVEGCSYGVASALIYLVEALLFYTGAVLIANGTYTYLQMIEVLNLVVFTVTIGAQLMAFTERIAKAVQATNDFNRLLKLSPDTEESHGVLRPPLMGTVAFKDVHFAYPERADVPVLKGLSLELRDSECVAVVGASGSGKSTVAALLQRLYEPASGVISIGQNEIRSTDVRYLRDHVAVVSQNPNLFDASIAENIAYGDRTLGKDDIQRAAMAAHVHDFITSLPRGYDTPVGENAALISGGQAQRIQIARALARPCKVLILDECTSALDPANQAAVMETLRAARVGRTTLMVTHKLAVMKMCDRIAVVEDGRVAEEGTYDELVQRRGIFAQLARGGEWDS